MTIKKMQPGKVLFGDGFDLAQAESGLSGMYVGKVKKEDRTYYRIAYRPYNESHIMVLDFKAKDLDYNHHDGSVHRKGTFVSRAVRKDTKEYESLDKKLKREAL